MRAIFTGSTATTVSTHPSESPPNTSTSQGSSPPQPKPFVSVSPAEDALSPRRIKSKSSLRSIRSIGSSSVHEDDYDDFNDQPGSDKSLIRPSILRRLSPGLAARVKLLDGSSKNSSPSSRNQGTVGRIPEEHIKELDSLHQSRSIKVEKKGRTWNGIPLVNKSSKQQQQQQPQQYLDVLDPSPTFGSAFDSELDVPTTGHLGLLEPTTADRTLNTTHQPEQEVAEAEVEAGEEEVGGAVATMSVVDSSTPLGPGSVGSNLQDQTRGPTDFEKFIQRTSEHEENGIPPPPPPKDTPPLLSSHASSNSQSYFNPLGLQRTESIYSFSRASFSNQLSQLTSITLPQPASLEASIAAISNAPSAVKALTGAAEQIQIWIRKASDVLSGLDAEDDIEWAAAGGREGLDEVDKAITKFESLVNVYVKAIENVQLRKDIANVGAEALERIVMQMDSILQSWAQIKLRLRGVKGQVELAMEWEELWNNVLGDVGAEVDNLSRLIFEMEEKRHFTMTSDQPTSNGLDINELETIVEETPSNGMVSSTKRLSMGPIFAAAPTLDTPMIQTPQDDSNHSNLIALFARIQPLRASLDFLPMRLSMFQSRAERIFPSACQELEDRRSQLEKSYKVLEADAESLRKELSEDRWILVFRNAGGQAQKMFESVERSIAKLQEGLETGAHLHNAAGLTKRIESYEAKKQHYIPAIERVVSIIQKGVNDRLTVNGETLRLLSDMTSRIDALKASIRVMDSSLEDIHHLKTSHLRDSISSILTMDSPVTGSVVDTPGSSPASSVIMTPALKGASTPLGSSSRRGSSVGSAARATSKARRLSGIPQASSALPGKKSALPKTSLTAPTPSKMNGLTTPTPATRKLPRPSVSPIPNRPRWNGSTNTNDLEVGHVYKSSSSRKSSAPSRLSRPPSTVPLRSPSRDPSASPAPPALRSVSRVSSRLESRSPARTGSPTPNTSLLDPPPYSKMRRPAGAENLSNAPRSRQSYAGASFSRSVSQDHNQGFLSPTKATRPGTALGHSGSRRISLLPLPKTPARKDNTPTTRSKLADRPPWR